jgi:prefoldin subunit 5
MPKTNEAMWALINSGRLTDSQLRIISENLHVFTGALDALAEEQEGIANETDKYRKQIDLLNDTLSELNAIISAIDGAVGTFAEVQQDVIQLDYERAKRELQKLASQTRYGTLPDSEALEGVLGRLTSAADSRAFTSGTQEAVENARIRANLGIIGDEAKQQVTAVEHQIDLLEKMLDSLNGIEGALVGQDSTELPTTVVGEVPHVDGGGFINVGSRQDEEQWVHINELWVKMYASLRAQELRMNKWDKDGLPPPRDLDNNAVNIIAMQGK